MSVTGLCQVCENATATQGCDRCGRLVCDAHYDDSAHLCVDCARRMAPDMD